MPLPGLLGLLFLLVTTAAACGPSPRSPTPAPGPGEPSPQLPPIPRVAGPLDLRVSYPRDSAFVATRGHNFIFGSAGPGDARVWINGEEVDVQPNGGFLAFLPVPTDSVYRLRATLEGQTDTLSVPIRLPEETPPPGDSSIILPGSPYPTGGWAALPDERIEVGFRGTADGSARILLPDGSAIRLVERPDPAGGATDFEVAPGDDAADFDPHGAAYSWYRGYFTAQPLSTPDTTVYWPELASPRPLSVTEVGAGVAMDGEGGTETTPTQAFLELASGADTVRQPLAFNLAILDADRPRVGAGYDLDPPEQNGDGAIIARPGPGGGPYHYTWANGTELTLTGERNRIFRVRLAEDLDVWSPAGDIQLTVPGTPLPDSRVATVRMDPQPGYIDVRVALDRRLPYQVQETDSSVRLVIFGALSRANFLQHGRTDPYIDRAEWDQPTNERFVLDVHTTATPWGYETFWDEAEDLVLRLRRPPPIRPEAPLQGLRVGVDAGHGGADRFTMGPTGLTEADANLDIALALREELERRGAQVVMTRTTDTTVSLVERTTLARARDVDLWVSVHNNAFPDGVNPWENNGTSVYYNHPRAASLAWSVQRELLEELGLRDLGVGRADLHQARFTWAPAILTEIMFMMIPEQEAALRTESVQRRIAEAHARGIAEWLRIYALSMDGSN
ncbi:MAG TPA: N-acetylmuramoyl-L-alanine amidase [Longimicrobiales bacterium]|nr:N-acetylmuramoyl-L-alanine amidase [Longimicrobiales bacterium]